MAARARHLLRQPLLELAVVRQAGEGVAPRRLLRPRRALQRLGVQARVGQRHRDHAREALHRRPLVAGEQPRGAEAQEQAAEQLRHAAALHGVVLQAQPDQRAGAEPAGDGRRDRRVHRQVLDDHGRRAPAAGGAASTGDLRPGQAPRPLEVGAPPRVDLGGVDRLDPLAARGVDVAGGAVRLCRLAGRGDHPLDGRLQVEVAAEDRGERLVHDALARLGGRDRQAGQVAEPGEAGLVGLVEGVGARVAGQSAPHSRPRTRIGEATTHRMGGRWPRPASWRRAEQRVEVVDPRAAAGAVHLGQGARRLERRRLADRHPDGGVHRPTRRRAPPRGSRRTGRPPRPPRRRASPASSATRPKTSPGSGSPARNSATRRMASCSCSTRRRRLMSRAMPA